MPDKDGRIRGKEEFIQKTNAAAGPCMVEALKLMRGIDPKNISKSDFKKLNQAAKQLELSQEAIGMAIDFVNKRGGLKSPMREHNHCRRIVEHESCSIEDRQPTTPAQAAVKKSLVSK